MRRLASDLLAQLRPHLGPRELFLGVGTLCVVCVWVTLGSGRSLLAALGPALGGDPYAEWYAYLAYHLGWLVLMGVAPLAALRLVWGVPLRELGVCLGDWRWGLSFLGLGALLVTPLVYAGSLDPAFQAEYPLTKLAGRSPGHWVLWELTYLIYYLGWEGYFRGALLFGLRERLGTGGSLLVQTAISTLVHIGKPLGELVGAAPGGILFGAAALRSRSLVWPLLLHWYLGALMDLLAYHAALAGR